MTRALPVIATGLHSVGVTFPQLLALLSLTAHEFGQFSLLYLVYAFGSSCMMSIVCEPWARSRDSTEAAHLPRVSATVALPFALLALPVGMLTGLHVDSVACGALTVLVSTAWVANRYSHAAQSRWRLLIAAESTALVSALLLFAMASLLGAGRVTALLLAWSAYSLTAITMTRSLALPSLRALRSWIRDRYPAIRLLLADSLLLDAGSIGTPFILFPFLGSAAFGRYRAISNIAFPVRLIFGAVRPMLGRIDAARAASVGAQLALTSAGLVLGVCAGLAVVLIHAYAPDLGVIPSLRPYALHVAVFIVATTSSTLNYYFCRLHATGAQLLTGRTVQTIIMIAAPLVGFWSGGESGAITGFTAGAVALAVLWLVVFERTARQAPAAA